MSSWTEIEENDESTWPPEHLVWLIVPEYARCAMLGHYESPDDWITYGGTGVELDPVGEDH